MVTPQFTPLLCVPLHRSQFNFLTPRPESPKSVRLYNIAIVYIFCPPLPCIHFCPPYLVYNFAPPPYLVYIFASPYLVYIFAFPYLVYIPSFVLPFLYSRLTLYTYSLFVLPQTLYLLTPEMSFTDNKNAPPSDMDLSMRLSTLALEFMQYSDARPYLRPIAQSLVAHVNTLIHRDTAAPAPVPARTRQEPSKARI